MAKPAEKMKNIRKYVPLSTFICFAVALVSLITLGFIKRSADTAEFFNRTTGRAIRFTLTNIFDIFPFSFVEILVIASPVLAALVVFAMIKKGKKSLAHATRFFCVLLSVALVIFSCFVFGYEASYYGYPIEKNTNVERRALSTEELSRAAQILHGHMEKEIDSVSYKDSGSSEMTYSFSELSKKLNVAAKSFCEKYPEYQSMNSRIKPVMLSEPWTYTHISGLYSFFTGEANLNVNYPDFIIVTSAAHEMSHQRGVGKEEEADFAAFLICLESDDPYIRYCGCLEIYRLIMGRLYSYDSERWQFQRAVEDTRIRGDIDAFAVFYEKYADNVAAKVNDVINDAYITSHNQPAGIQSYGLVVDLAVSYILSNANLYSEN
ncbi:MAG: DUF3810 domain-containing protein [Clostridiales bacterium]|nr:DUF3810 domain-containing protein [Clostridiales bacterium]